MLRRLKFWLKYSKLADFIRLYLGVEEREKIIDYALAFTKFCQVDGDYLEFGVYEGRTLAFAYHLAKRYKVETMSFYAFDSFAGLPEITGKDADGFCPYKKDFYKCDLETFKKIIANKGVDIDKVNMVPGWFNQTLNKETRLKLPIKKAAVVYIDCDLYESTIPVLNFIKDYLQNGTVLVFDDWYDFRGDPTRGERAAFKKWMTENKNFKAIPFRKFSWHGNSFIMNLKKQ